MDGINRALLMESVSCLKVKKKVGVPSLTVIQCFNVTLLHISLLSWTWVRRSPESFFIILFLLQLVWKIGFNIPKKEGEANNKGYWEIKIWNGGGFDPIIEAHLGHFERDWNICVCAYVSNDDEEEEDDDDEGIARSWRHSVYESKLSFMTLRGEGGESYSSKWENFLWLFLLLVNIYGWFLRTRGLW